MPGDAITHRFYGELARWWPLISPPEEYEEEATFAGGVLRTASIPVRDVLELGSGGGSNAFYLKRWFAITLVDLSEDMLAVSRNLNPECDHAPGDMRSVRLGRQFDAVFIHDAIDYMLDEADLRLAFETAFVHCRPGGVAVIVPDCTTETFTAETDVGGRDDVDGRGVRYLLWSWDPDPDDSWASTEYAFLLREADGSVDVVHETHRCGLFARDVWLRLLTDTGFRPNVVMEETVEDRTPRAFFVAHRPLP